MKMSLIITLLKRFLQVSLVLGMLPAAWLPAQTSEAAYGNSSLPAAERAHEVVAKMTLDEKAAQLEDYATAIPRLGIPDYQTWSEALHGVANSGYATVFPQAIGMAATWDPDLVKEMGDIISTEGRAKYNQAQREDNHRIFYGLTFWSPNINIFRDPRWGRGQETYGEDPFLTSRMGVAFIEGVQGPDPEHPKAVATSKHYAVHSGPESQRHVFNVDVSPRDLEETYLPAFRATVMEGQVKSVMCAYNAIDGDAACANKMLLVDHLRNAWGFKGFVVSDCGAIVDVTKGHHNAPDILHAAVISLEAGTDLSCSIWSPGFNTLADAVRQGLVPEADVTRAAERLYTARYELGMFDAPGTSAYDKIPYAEDASEEHRAVALKAAQEAIVLLKNTGVLPLGDKPRSIAVVGATADLLPSIEGNYNGTAVHPVYPLDGIIKQFPAATIHYAQGATLATGTAVPVPRTVFGDGLQAEYFATPDWTGRPVVTRTEPEIQYNWRDSFPVSEIATHDYSVRWTGTMAVPAAGKYTLILQDLNEAFPYSPSEKYRLVLDGKVLAEGELNGAKIDMGAFTFAPGASPTAPPVMKSPAPARVEFDFSDTKPHALTVEYSHSGDRAGGGLVLQWEAPAAGQLAEAVAAARASDVVLAFVGLSPRLEGEEMPIHIEGFAGGDRTSIDLPASQQKLLEAVAATGKPVVVISMSGSALALTWARDHAAAVLSAWYPGVEGGTAIAQTLAGLNNPAGRLPVTFYASTGELPAFTDYSMKNRTYRYFTGKPLWGFGYGLSYSSFKYGPVQLSSSSVAAGQSVTATVTVTNTSSVAGDEVVEAYLKTPQVDGPLRSLVGFKRVHLGAGESRVVPLEISARSLSSVDAQGERSVLAGGYSLAVGGAQPAEAAGKSEVTFSVTGSVKLAK
jgi:beta-glucosidase